MTIRTYTEMMAEVESWLNRDDPDTINRIPTFIRFAEKEIFRVLKLPVYEIVTQLDVVNNRCKVPADLIRLKEIYNSEGHGGRQTDHKILLDIEAGRTGGEYDKFYFARIGDEYRFQADKGLEGVDVFCNYYRGPDFLDSVQQTTPLLDLAPDLILFTALRHGAVFAEDTEKAAYWEQRSDNAMQEIMKQLADDDMEGSAHAVEGKTGVSIYW